MFRIGYRTASFDAMNLAGALRALGQAGYDSVEICLERHELAPGKLTPEVAARVQEAVLKAGLGIHSISFHGDALPWPERAAGQQVTITAAGWFGTRTVVLNTPKSDEGVGWDALRQHFAALAASAAQAGVTLAVEPEPGLMVSSVADALRLLDEVDSPALAVNLDVGHAFLTEGDVVAAIGALAGTIVHVHFEDMPATEHRHLLPGQGDMPLADVVVALWDAGFRGVLTVDLFGPYDDPLAVAVQALRASRATVREAMTRVRRRDFPAL
ncbi:MAG: sugar phosphate isomerase/epimerase [Armatimonadetes bacterium]|nr:sugar phosphate isomerase/epimerase [Armatimonadota bacterium]